MCFFIESSSFDSLDFSNTGCAALVTLSRSGSDRGNIELAEPLVSGLGILADCFSIGEIVFSCSSISSSSCSVSSSSLFDSPLLESALSNRVFEKFDWKCPSVRSEFVQVPH